MIFDAPATFNRNSANSNGRVPSFEEIKAYAVGRSSEIIAFLGLSTDLFDGKHHTCPFCHELKFRCSNADQFACGCDKCGWRCTSVIDFVKDILNCSAVDAGKHLTKLLGITASNRHSLPAVSRSIKPQSSPPSKVEETTPPERIEFEEWNEQVARMWLHRKGMFPAAMIAEHGADELLRPFGAKLAKFWFQDDVTPVSVIAFLVYGPDLSEPVNWSLYRLDGRPFFGETKTRVAFSGKSRVGVLLTVDALELLRRGEPIENLTIIKTEGVTDWIAAETAIHNREGDVRCFILWTNSDGCRSTGTAAWSLPMLARLEPASSLVIHDCDKPGQAGAVTQPGSRHVGWANLLAAIAPTKNIVLPYPIEEKKGKDLRNFLNDGHAWADVETIVDAALHVEPAVAQFESIESNSAVSGAGLSRPEVLVSLNEAEVARQVIGCLGRLGWESPWIPEQIRDSVKIYQRGGNLVSVTKSEDPNDPDGTLRIQQLPQSITRERITQACELVEERGTEPDIELQPVRPPKWLIESVHQRVSYDGEIKALAGIIQSPTLRSDGSILQVPGWDPQTNLLYQPLVEFPLVPENPTKQDALKAANELLDVVVDFPFVGSDEITKRVHNNSPDKSAWLCFLLTLIARVCINGCTPLFSLTANVRASGKSLLVDVVSIIVFGHKAARRIYVSDSKEMRKSITAIAIEGLPLTFFDNVDQSFGGACVDAALTSSKWTDRLLSTNTTTGDLPLTTVWAATGNNITYIGDSPRRTLPVRLQSPHEAPEERTDLTHKDLLGWTMENRPRLAVAALTVLRAYFVSGCPPQPNGTWGSFEEWTRIIRGAVVWCGLADPLITRETAKSSDGSRELLGLIIAGLQEADAEGAGLTSKQIESITIYRPDEKPTCPTLVEAVEVVCGSKYDGRKFARQLIVFLNRPWKQRGEDGKPNLNPTLRIINENAGKGVKRWKVQVDRGGLGGLGGSQNANACDESPAQKNIDCCDSSQKPPAITWNPPHQPIPPLMLCSCGASLVPASPVGNFRNWDCPTCKSVFPVKIQELSNSHG